MSEKIDNFFSYLPINENNMRWGLYLTGVGLATVQARDVYPLKGHPGVYNFRWESGLYVFSKNETFIALS